MHTKLKDFPLAGELTVITGPMGSGKSGRAIEITERSAHYFDEGTTSSDVRLLVRHAKDTRPYVSRKVNIDIPLVTVDSASRLADTVLSHKDARIIWIDEAELYDSPIVDVVEALRSRDFYVVITGLQKNFRGEPFSFSDYKGTMDDILLLAKPAERISLLALCDKYVGLHRKCGSLQAEYTQRVIVSPHTTLPAPYYTPLFVIGDEHAAPSGNSAFAYQARCREHFAVPGKDETYAVCAALQSGLFDRDELLKLANKHPLDQIVRMLTDEQRITKEMAHHAGFGQWLIPAN